jgi:hypothetical protein
MEKVFLFLNLISSFYMLGIIWIVQSVHYPAFAAVDSEKFVNFHKNHTEALGPAMIVELLSSVALFFIIPENLIFTGANLFLTLITWILTFFLSVPLHNKLSKGYDLNSIRKLVKTNWLRTMIWTVRSATITVLFFQVGLI